MTTATVTIIVGERNEEGKFSVGEITVKGDGQALEIAKRMVESSLDPFMDIGKGREEQEH